MYFNVCVCVAAIVSAADPVAQAGEVQAERRVAAGQDEPGRQRDGEVRPRGQADAARRQPQAEGGHVDAREASARGATRGRAHEARGGRQEISIAARRDTRRQRAATTPATSATAAAAATAATAKRRRRRRRSPTRLERARKYAAWCSRWRRDVVWQQHQRAGELAEQVEVARRRRASDAARVAESGEDTRVDGARDGQLGQQARRAARAQQRVSTTARKIQRKLNWQTKQTSG